MSANNHALPAVGSSYTNFVTELHGRIDDAVVQMRSDQVTATNVPVGAIRWNNANTNWEKNTATVVGTPTWAALATTYAITATNVVTNANLTGMVTSSGNATTVVTNANLTGPITSSGNATTIASQTGTGTTFAMSASPTFTGTPSGPTAAVDTNTVQFATTAYVIGQSYLKTTTAASTYAPIASPTFTGTPSGPTAAVDTNTTQFATTAYVIGQTYLKTATAASTYAPLASPTLTGTPLVPNPISGTVGIGYRNIPGTAIGSVSSYTATATHAACAIIKDTTTACTVTITASLAQGITITIINDAASGNITLASSDTFILAGGTVAGSKIIAPGGVCTIYKSTTSRIIYSGPGVT